jgi:hypothetical protein
MARFKITDRPVHFGSPAELRLSVVGEPTPTEPTSEDLIGVRYRGFTVAWLTFPLTVSPDDAWQALLAKREYWLGSRCPDPTFPIERF